MRIGRNAVGLLAVAGLAYTAGHLNVFSGVSEALAQEQDGELDAETLAYMEANSPGKHHEALNVLEGDFEGTFTLIMEPGAEPMKSEGVISRKWILGGRFMKEVVEAESSFGTFQGLAYMGYNNAEGQYEFVWMESMSTAMYFETGYIDQSAKVLRTRGTHRNPVTGQVTATRGEVDFSDPDRHVYRGYAIGPDGKEYVSFKGTARRI